MHFRIRPFRFAIEMFMALEAMRSGQSYKIFFYYIVNGLSVDFHALYHNVRHAFILKPKKI